MSGSGAIDLLPRTAATNDFPVLARIGAVTADLQICESNHRIKNSLQLVASLLANSGRAARDAGVSAEFGKAALQIQAIARLHEHLQDADADCVDAAELLGSICADLSLAARLDARQVRISLNTEPMLLPPEEARMLGMVTAELATNALKHAYACRSGEIRIELTNGALQRRLSVTNSTTTRDTSVVRPGQGTRLVHDLAKRLGGVVVTSDVSNTHKVDLLF